VRWPTRVVERAAQGGVRSHRGRASSQVRVRSVGNGPTRAAPTVADRVACGGGCCGAPPRACCRSRARARAPPAQPPHRLRRRARSVSRSSLSTGTETRTLFGCARPILGAACPRHECCAAWARSPWVPNCCAPRRWTLSCGAPSRWAPRHMAPSRMAPSRMASSRVAPTSRVAPSRLGAERVRVRVTPFASHRCERVGTHAWWMLVAARTGVLLGDPEVASFTS
jgi:hypothetical protein